MSPPDRRAGAPGLLARTAAWCRDGWMSYAEHAEYGVVGFWVAPPRRPDPDHDALPAAVLWDMDGTLADTEPHWIAAREAVAREHGIPWGPDDAHAFVGAPLAASAEAMRGRGLSLDGEALIAEIVGRALDGIRSDLRWRPGALELLHSIADAGIPCALVTMAYRPVAEYVARSAHPTAFHAVVAGDDVAHGKPHPEAYLTAAAALGVDPAGCLAIEDTETGARSASAAGVPTLLVSHRPELTGIAGIATRPSLAGLGFRDLAVIRGEAHAA